MDSLSDDDLRRTFGKLKEYQSPQKGIEWTALSREMDKHFGVSRIFYSFLLLTIVSILMVSPRTADAPVSISGDGSPVVSPTRSAEKTTVPETHLPRENAPEHGSIASAVTRSEIFLSVQPVELNKQFVPALFRSSSMTRALGPMRVAFEHFEFPAPSGFDSTSMEEERRQPTFSPRLTISPFYMFGVVDPLKYDHTMLKTYTSRPGGGILTQLMFKTGTRGEWEISTGPSYEFMFKRFRYTAIQYYGERLEHTTTDFTATAHRVGWGGNFERAGSVMGVYVSQATGNKSFTKFIGRTAVSFSFMKEIRPRGFPQHSFFAGGSVSVPVAGELADFKYYPIQLIVGVRPKSLRKRE